MAAGFQPPSPLYRGNRYWQYHLFGEFALPKERERGIIPL
jgi:hypothetical protein